MDDILDRFNLTPKQKEEIKAAWEHFRIAGLAPDVYVLARILEPEIEWTSVQKQFCEECNKILEDVKDD